MEVGPERVEFILKVVVERRVIRERLMNGIDETQSSELIADFEITGGFKTQDEAVEEARKSADLVARNIQ